jgi:two-component system, sensor histidine kinase and response regulator
MPLQDCLKNAAPVTDQSPPNRGDIMVVDDNPANLRLLEDMLRRQGHEVHSFPRGRLALAAAARNPPDLMLLDINMPEMDGYEVCERLRSTEQGLGIPVIFLSAMSEIEDKMKAFQAGAVDYVSKPFQLEEVLARVETHLKLHCLQRTLRLQNEHLEEAVAARTRELAEANGRLTILDRAKNEFLTLISHELRTPLNGLLGVGDLILELLVPTEENKDLRGLFQRSRRRVLSIMDDALLLTEIDVNKDRFRCLPVSVSAVLRRAIDGTAGFADSRRVKLTQPSSEIAGMDMVVGDEDLLVRAVQALIETAVRFSKEGEAVGMAREAVPGSVRVIVEGHGRTIPIPALPKFFDLLSIKEAITPGGDLGLGPAMAFRILALFGASVSVANRDPSGIRLTISLKAAVPELCVAH